MSGSRSKTLKNLTGGFGEERERVISQREKETTAEVSAAKREKGMGFLGEERERQTEGFDPPKCGDSNSTTVSHTSRPSIFPFLLSSLRSDNTRVIYLRHRVIPIG